MSDNEQCIFEEIRARQAEADAKATRIVEAVKAGILIPEIGNMPDGGRSLFDKETWDKLHNFSLLRPANAMPRR